MVRIIGLIAVVCLWASAASAQSSARVEFSASADHSTAVGSTPLVTGYQLDVMVDTATGALAFTKSLGKPSPSAQGEIVVPLPEFAARPNGVYVGRVSAQGPGGSTPSLPSAPFAWIGQPPAPPGQPRVVSVVP